MCSLTARKFPRTTLNIGTYKDLSYICIWLIEFGREHLIRHFQTCGPKENTPSESLNIKQPLSVCQIDSLSRVQRMYMCGSGHCAESDTPFFDFESFHRHSKHAHLSALVDASTVPPLKYRTTFSGQTIETITAASSAMLPSSRQRGNQIPRSPYKCRHPKCRTKPFLGLSSFELLSHMRNVHAEEHLSFDAFILRGSQGADISRDASSLVDPCERSPLPSEKEEVRFIRQSFQNLFGISKWESQIPFISTNRVSNFALR